MIDEKQFKETIEMHRRADELMAKNPVNPQYRDERFEEFKDISEEVEKLWENGFLSHADYYGDK